MIKEKSSALALLPILVFIGIFVGAGIITGNFYALPSPIAALVAIVFAFIFIEGSMNTKINKMLSGFGDTSILSMCTIYILAGAFASLTKEMGSINATVNLGIKILPGGYIVFAVFVLSAFLSTSTGTSVGAIVSLGPLVVTMASTADIHLPLIMAALLSGAMFGDNLSIISDTTIAATQTQGCRMNDKFKVNIFIALPAAIISMIFFLYLSPGNIIPQEVNPININSIILIVPYLVVLVMAIAGINVFLVLLLGIISAGIIGFYYDSFDIIGYGQIIYKGFANMNEIFLLTMLTGGLAKLVEYGGGINYILKKSEAFIKGKKTAQLASGFIIMLLDIALANNTLAIIISSPVIVNIRNKYNIDKRKMAALVDIFSCVAQGLLPFGAQILIMFKFADNSVNYSDILPYMIYLYILFILAVISIVLSQFDKKILKLI